LALAFFSRRKQIMWKWSFW